MGKWTAHSFTNRETHQLLPRRPQPPRRRIAGVEGEVAVGFEVAAAPPPSLAGDAQSREWLRLVGRERAPAADESAGETTLAKLAPRKGPRDAPAALVGSVFSHLPCLTLSRCVLSVKASLISASHSFCSVARRPGMDADVTGRGLIAAFSAKETTRGREFSLG